MASTAPNMPRSKSDNLDRQSGAPTRPRPPPLNLSYNDALDRVALRPDAKINRRESRLGLRNIFGRSKTPKQADAPVISPRFIPRSTTIGSRMAAPLTPSTNRPYENHPLPSNKPIVVSHITRPLSTFVENQDPTPEPQQPVTPSPGLNKTSKATPKPIKGEVAQWAAPPLFKAYPQATKWITLEAPTASADAMVRAHEKRTDQASSAADAIGESDKDKSRRRRRTNMPSENKRDWTNKIYLLVTSGFLLEYTSEGPFDRLPDRVLRLNQSSAVFASDLIPGRHWVLQIASSFGPVAAPTAESKSIFSIFPFRGGAERRNAANLVMVFENAIEMNQWQTAIREVIEDQGGRQTLSETGKPKVKETAAALRGQISQRTLVVRDPERYSRSAPPTSPWSEELARRESGASAATEHSVREQSFDGVSATNSFVSTDGRQLDSLRGSNRLSYLSSGQRTVITSAGSSPSCSPTAETFNQMTEESSRRPESRLRPNASAIVDRRKSLQTIGVFVEPKRGQSSPRPQSTLVGSASGDSGTQKPTPNFSVPNSSSRRFSYMKPAPASPTEGSPPLSPPLEVEEPLARTGVRKPPTALRNTRPLSMVADQPSPKSEFHEPERPATRHGEIRPSSSLDAEPLPSPTSGTFFMTKDASDSESRRSSIAPRSPIRPNGLNSPRRLSRSMGALRHYSDASNTLPLDMPPMPRSVNASSARVNDPERCHSSADIHDQGVPLSPTSARMAKRSSMHSFVSPVFTPTFAPLAPPPSAPLPPLPPSKSVRSSSLAASGSPREVTFSRRSLSQLADMPPPVPPPTCALPPIPSKYSTPA